MVNSENKLDIPQEKMPEWWGKLTDQEQYDYFRQMAIEYVKMNKIINEEKQLTNEAKTALINSNDFLKKYIPFYPLWGLEISFIGLFDSFLTTDIIFNINLKKFFLKGHIFISPGFDFKISKRFNYNDIGIGGGFNLGIGFLL